MDRARTWVPRATALAALVVYLVCAPSGPYWLDSGELSAAGVGLGIAHPTGFPLYAMLVKLASLLPLGELAFRVNLLSGLCAAAAVWSLCRLVLAVAGDDLAALVGAAGAGAALAMSLTFFRQATVAEVYAPMAALLSAALLLFHRVAAGGGARDGLLLAVVCGLGLAVHVSFALIGVPVVVLLVVRLYRGARWVLAAPLLVVAVTGGLYLYLPVRAAARPDPSVQWSRADRAGAFLDQVTGAGIRAAYAGEMRSTDEAVWIANARAFFGEAAEELLLVLLAAVGGVAWLLRHRRTRWAGALLLAVAAGDSIYSVWINPMGQVDLQNGVPFALAVCAAAGAGVALLARVFGRASLPAGAALAVIMVVPVAMDTQAAGAMAARTGDLPRAFAQACLDETPPRGLALVTNDSTAAGLIFLTAIEGARPDVTVIVRQRSREGWRVRRLLDLAAPDGHGQAGIVGARPMTWELGPEPLPRGYRLVLDAPLAHLMPAGAASPGGSADAAAARLARLFDDPSARDASARLALGHALSQVGRIALQRGDTAGAARALDAAVGVDPRYPPALVNRGAVAAARGDLAAAVGFTERAVAEDPNLVIARINAARYLIGLGRDGAARVHVERVRRLHPDNASAVALLGLLEARAGHLERAANLAERALAIDPANRDAQSLRQQLRAH